MSVDVRERSGAGAPDTETCTVREILGRDGIFRLPLTGSVLRNSGISHRNLHKELVSSTELCPKQQLSTAAREFDHLFSVNL